MATSGKDSRHDRGTLRPRARLVGTIGEDLISSESVALIELVKNAYDADATQVLIRFHGPLEKGLGAVEVLDDGHGMSFDTIRMTWLHPATEFRRSHTRSDTGRRVLGEKGIGRFAASKLADRMLLVSRPPDGPEVQLIVDWADFRDSTKFLDEIQLRWDEGPAAFFAEGAAVHEAWTAAGLPPVDHGTLLRLDELRTTWSVDTVRKLQIDLARLVTRSSTASSTVADDFIVVLDLPGELDRFSGPVAVPTAIEAAPYELLATVDAAGHVRVTVDIKGISSDLEFDLGTRGEEIACGPFDIRLRVWDRDAAAVRAQAGTEMTAKDFRALLDSAAGVSVYRDGFRVFPYGEEGNDWLKLDRRRIQNPGLRISNNQVVGEVHITADGNPLLRDQSNREGLVAGAAYDTFVDAVQQILAVLETRRRMHRKKPPPGTPDRSTMWDSFTVADIVDVATERGVDPQVVGMLEARGRAMSAGVEHVRDVLGRYSRLATLGRLIDDISHDGQHAVGAFRDAVDAAARAVRGTAPCEERLASVRDELEVAGQQVDLLSALFRRIEPFGGRRRGRPQNIDLGDVVRDAVRAYESRAKRQKTGLEVTGDVGDVSLDPDEVREVVANLVENALYWVQRVAEEDRFVRVDVERAKDGVTVTVHDSGPGVPPDVHDDIYEPYFTTKPDGVGLGLAIVGELLTDHYGGTLDHAESDLGGVAFRALFRRRV